jgi:hypothetical protein
VRSLSAVRLFGFASIGPWFIDADAKREAAKSLAHRPYNVVQDRVARGIHHFITSSGQKAWETFVEGSSARIFGTESGGIGSRALAAARVFGAFHRLEAALAFFLGAFVILANAPQGRTLRPV